MALYNTVPAEDLRQESPKSIKKIVVVSAVTSFVLGACAATALSYREVGASRATQLVAQTDCQAKYPNLCSDDGCNCRGGEGAAPAGSHPSTTFRMAGRSSVLDRCASAREFP